MKVERLYEIAKDIQADLKATKIVAATEALATALQNQINSPNPDHQQQISTQRDNLIKALGTSRVNNYPPSWLKDLEIMGIHDYFGNTLANWVNEIFSRNQITPNDAHKEISEIKKELDNISNSINNLVASFKYLEFKPENLEPGEYEISVTIPREAIHNELGELGKELSKLESIFTAFSKVVTGTVEPFQLRAISTSDPTIFISALPEIAAAVADAIEKIVALYAGVLSIIIMRRDLKKENVPNDIIIGLEKHVKDKVAAGIDDLIKEIKQKYFGKLPKERHNENELEQDLKRALKGIASRLDQGYGFDVRGEPTEEAAGDASTPEGEQKEKKPDINYQIVTDARNKIRFFKPQEEPILALPKPIDEELPGNPKKK